MDSSTLAAKHYENQRQNWLNAVREEERRPYVELLLSSHSLLLLHDIELAFLGGAWLSVIALSQSAIEGTIRQLQTNDYKSKAKDLFEGNEALQRIRSLRNEIIHPQEPGTVSVLWTVANGDVINCHANQETDAKRAITLVYRALYEQATSRSCNGT